MKQRANKMKDSSFVLGNLLGNKNLKHPDMQDSKTSTEPKVASRRGRARVVRHQDGTRSLYSR